MQLTVFYCLLTVPCSLGLLIESEYRTLQELYESTGGDHWSWGRIQGNMWEFSGETDPCRDTWKGVACNSDSIDNCNMTDCSVLNLNMQRINMNGVLPNRIGGFSFSFFIILIEIYYSS